MARGPTYRVPFRRRREGKTNYYLRRKLLLSGKLRAIIRPSLKNIICQVADAHLKGDHILVSATGRELEKDYGWKYNKGNLPAAYLVGYLLGKKALKAGIDFAIADIGLRIHINRTFAALKGMIDAGLEIPHSERIFPPEERLLGHHIEDYYKQVIVNSDDNEKENNDSDADAASGISKQKSKPFSKLNENGVDISKISSVVENIKNKIDEKYA
ncbi:MAG: 50S ribosomal protein L18 [Promethearchaeota archaeon]